MIKQNFKSYSFILNSLILLLLFSISLKANENLKSQPEIVFKYDEILENHKNLTQQVDFNKAVLNLQNGEYLKAINILKKTSKYLKIPSYLNIGIAYYKLDSFDNARLYLNRIYNHEEAIYKNTYSYMSACYYLYLITDNKNFLKKIIDVAKTKKALSEHDKRLVADTYIILKDYQTALELLEDMEFASDLKKALLNIKLKDYDRADFLLTKAYEETLNKKTQDTITWLKVFSNLKANNITKLHENLDIVDLRGSDFEANLALELRIFYNKNKYLPRDYFNFVTNFNEARVIDYIYYFAPYIFSDSEEIMYDSSKGFIFRDKQSLENLEEMVTYNASFIELINQDPIKKIVALEKLLNKDTKSYVYYNLALSYAQIGDFFKALKYFQQATKLNPGNKLYSMMTLITAKRSNTVLRDNDYLENIVRTKSGMYQYFAQRVYSLVLNDTLKVDIDPLLYSNTILYRALDFLEKFQNKTATLEEPLIVQDFKEPLTFLIKKVIKRDNENDFEYFSRLQDSIPLEINDNFLDGPIIITHYYLDLVRALGLFERADFNMKSNITPTYRRTQAFKLLYDGYPKEALSILENLQEEYKIEDKYTMYLIVAALLEDDQYNEASLQISLIRNLLKDSNAEFLTGVQLIQELKMTSAKQFIQKPYLDDLIDFKLVGFDEFLESL